MPRHCILSTRVVVKTLDSVSSKVFATPRSDAGIRTNLNEKTQFFSLKRHTNNKHMRICVCVHPAHLYKRWKKVWRVDKALDWGPEERESCLNLSVMGSVIMNKVPKQMEDQSSAPPQDHKTN